MARFYGDIGYADRQQTSPNVWKNVITFRQYYGEKIKDTTKVKDGESLNDDLTLDFKLSILADAFAEKQYSHIRCARIDGVLWKVTSVDVLRPRLILTIGGVYNVQSPDN